MISLSPEKGGHQSKDCQPYIADDEDIEDSNESYDDREIQPLLDASGEDLSTTKARSFWKRTDWRLKSVLVYLCIANYLNSICHSASSPFLARVILQKGGTVVLSSLVLQFPTLTMMVFCIIFGKYQAKIGSKTLIIAGLLCLGTTQIAFGAIAYFQSYKSLVAVGTLLRGLQGITQAGLKVAGLTIICQNFPDFISTAFGLYEAAYGAGYFTGPYIGGSLYDWSQGMMVPMAIIGVLILLFSLPGFGILVQREDKQDRTSGSHTWRIISNPKAVLIFGVSGTLVGGFGLCGATITVYLKPEGFSVTEVGQMLFFEGVAYSIFASIIGLVINSRRRCRRFVIALGTLCGFAFPFLWQPNQSDSWIYVGIVGFAMSTSFTFIPTFEELRYVISSDGSTTSNDVALNGAMSGVWYAASSLYSFFVPLVGSAMQATLMYFVSFVTALLVSYGVTILLMLLSAMLRKAYTTQMA